MSKVLSSAATTSGPVPWNKGKFIGAKPPLRPKHVWVGPAQASGGGSCPRPALLNLAIDCKLRGCDVVELKVDDIAPSGYAIDRATVRQRKRPGRLQLRGAALKLPPP